LVNFKGSALKELRMAFEDAVEDYSTAHLLRLSCPSTVLFLRETCAVDGLFNTFGWAAK